MPNGTYGGVRGKETKVGQKNFRFPTYSINFEFGMLDFEFGRVGTAIGNLSDESDWSDQAEGSDGSVGLELKLVVSGLVVPMI